MLGRIGRSFRAFRYRQTRDLTDSHGKGAMKARATGGVRSDVEAKKAELKGKISGLGR